MTFLLFFGGLAALVAGAELLVRGASRLALAWGMAPLAVGLTVVAYGTSAPELAVSAMSSVRGEPDLALGNAVGSNIFNLLFILGASALVAPLVVARQIIRVDVPIALGVALLLAAFAADGRIGRTDAAFLFAGLVGYTTFTLREARREGGVAPANGTTDPAPRPRVAIEVLFVLAGLALLVAGSRWLVAAAMDTARALGVSELVIGLTIVAAGTSLPEVATSLLAAIRGQRDIAVGNVIGSNIFNIVGVLGISGLVPEGGLPVAAGALRFDIPVMLAATFACVPIFLTGHRIDRWEGFLFLAYYAAYVAYLVLDAAGHDALPAFSAAMMAFVVPLSIITLLVVMLRSVRRGGAEGAAP